MSAERAARIVERIEALAQVSEEEGALTRRYGTPALIRALDLAEEWLRGAGLAVRRDAIGNLVGRLEGEQPGLPALALGSHLDTVRDGGRWDGPLGVLLAIDQAERLAGRAAGSNAVAAAGTLPFALEAVVFADEESLRFPTSYLGSHVWAGLWQDAELQLEDADGVPLEEAVRAMGGDPARIGEGARPGELLAWCEAHIEQGTRLESAGVPLGVVTSIQGQTRCSVAFHGQAGHAGTSAMDKRRDALLTAAEWALAVEAEGLVTEGLVATVGRLAVEPGATNVIPGLATATLDIRHPDDATLQASVLGLQAIAEEVAAARGVTVTWTTHGTNPAVRFSPRLQGLLGRAVEEAQGAAAPLLASGAGHDASPLSRITEVSMLFVRCKDGISHNPAESVETEDVAAAVAALDRFVDLLAEDERAGKQS